MQLQVLVCTGESFEYRSLIDKYQVGFNCKNNDEVDLADKLLKLYKDENLRKRCLIIVGDWQEKLE